MAKLYEIDRRILQVIESGFAFDEDTGEVWEAEDLEDLEAERNEKLEACALYIKDMEADAAAIRAEETALAERRRAKERRAESLRSYVAASMMAAGQSSMETARCSLRFRRSEAVEVTDAEALPAEMQSVKVTPNKAAIRKALKAGHEVAGARLVENQNLQLK